MDNTEYTRQKKHKTICVGHHYLQTNTINVNKIWALLQTTGGKDELNLIFMQKSQWTPQHGTLNAKIHVLLLW